MVTPDPLTVPTSSRRRGGRPPLPDAERRGHVVNFWVTTDEQARLTARAALAGVTVSAYVRDAALADAGTMPARRSRRPAGPDLGAVVAQLQRLGNNLNQILREARFGHFPPDVTAQAGAALEAMTAYLVSLAPVDDPET